MTFLQQWCGTVSTIVLGYTRLFKLRYMSEEDTKLLGGSVFELTLFFCHPFRLFDMPVASKLLVTDGKGGCVLREDSCQILSGSIEASAVPHYLNCMIRCSGRKHGERILQEDVTLS